MTRLARMQRLMIVGSRGPVEINPRDLMGKESSITGVALGMLCLLECLGRGRGRGLGRGLGLAGPGMTSVTR
jgi:hypothetical protein